jgi:serine/threonine protein kinase
MSSSESERETNGNMEKAIEIADDYFYKLNYISPDPLRFKTFGSLDLDCERDSVMSNSEVNISESEDEDEDEDEDEEHETIHHGKTIMSTTLFGTIFRFIPEFSDIECVRASKYCCVYYVTRKEDKKRCVITIRDDITPEAVIGKIPREIRIIKTAESHNNLVKSLGYCVVSDNVYAILTEFVPYVSPRIALFGNGMQIAKYIKDILEIIQHLADKGIIHRDICTDNILWDPVKEKAILIDFDNAAFIRYKGKNEIGSLRHCGHGGFNSPEKERVYYLRDSGRTPNHGFTSASQIYSVGVILWMMLEKMTDGPGWEIIEALRKQKIGVIKRIKKKSRRSINPAYDLAIRLTVNNPKKRMTAKDAMKHKFIAKLNSAKRNPLGVYNFLIEVVKSVEESDVEEENSVTEEDAEGCSDNTGSVNSSVDMDFLLSDDDADDEQNSVHTEIDTNPVNYQKDIVTKTDIVFVVDPSSLNFS